MRVGRYELGRLLGEGGMGSVHEAAHVVTGKRVAVKLLKPEVMAVSGALERFLTEARAACGVDHPNVVDVLDVDVEDGAAYMVIELLDGESLEERLERSPMSVAELWSVAEPLLAALAKAHARGILHRDLKPANIFLATDASGRSVPKLLDFGIAKLLGADELSLTATGHMVGTPLYMPPEIIGGEKSARPQCDIYSFAAVCYEALAGRAPFEATTLPQLLVAVSSGEAPPLEGFGVPAPVAAVIRTAMARDPGARFADAEAFASALGAAVGDAPVALADTAPSIPPGAMAPPSTPAPSAPGPRPWVWVAAALAAGAIGVAAYAGFAGEGENGPSAPPTAAEPPASPAAESEGAQTTAEGAAGRAPEPTPAAPELAPEAGAEAASPIRAASPRARPRGSESTMARPAPVAGRGSPGAAGMAAAEAPTMTATEAPTMAAAEAGEAAPLRVEGERSGGLSADEF